MVEDTDGDPSLMVAGGVEDSVVAALSHYLGVGLESNHYWYIRFDIAAAVAVAAAAAADGALGKDVVRAQVPGSVSSWNSAKVLSGRTLFEPSPESQCLIASPLSEICPVGELHQIYLKMRHPSGTGTHGRNCWASNFALAGHCNRPCSSYLNL